MLVEVRHVPAVFNSACLHHLVHLLTLIHWCNSSLKQDVALLVVPSLVLKLAVHTNHLFCVACSACLCSLLTLKSQVQGQAHLFASCSSSICSLGTFPMESCFAMQSYTPGSQVSGALLFLFPHLKLCLLHFLYTTLSVIRQWQPKKLPLDLILVRIWQIRNTGGFDVGLFVPLPV